MPPKTARYNDSVNLSKIQSSVVTGPTDMLRSIDHPKFDVFVASNEESKYSIFEMSTNRHE